MTTPLTVLAAQAAPVPGDPAANVARLEETLARHPAADLAVFPESYLSGYERREGAETPLDGDAIRAVCAAAARRRTAIIVGITEPRSDGAAANAALHIDAGGRVLGVHRKTHLFGRLETAWYVPGERLTVVPLAGWRVGVLICFEMEFPELARSLARAGADLLVTISANMAPYEADHELQSRARAIDNRLPHVYVNRVGAECGLEFTGGTRVIDPSGRVEAEAAAGEGVLVHAVTAPPPDPELDYVRLVRPGLGAEALVTE